MPATAAGGPFGEWQLAQVMMVLTRYLPRSADGCATALPPNATATAAPSSNLIGYIPLPTNTEHTAEIFGLEVPTLALYAATANISVPIILTLVVWFAYQAEGIRAKGFFNYIRGLIPSGTPGVLKGPIFVIEVISQFVRIISLSVRLFANILAGHMLILFMGGGLAVILGIAALGWLTLPLAIIFFLLEVGLVATLQAFIFATLSSIYFGEATAAGH